MSQRKACKKFIYSFSFLFAGFVVLQSSSYLLWIFSKYVPRNLDCFLVFKKPGTVTIATKYQYKDGRKTSGERRTIWKGVRLLIEKGEGEYNDNPNRDPSSRTQTINGCLIIIIIILYFLILLFFNPLKNQP